MPGSPARPDLRPIFEAMFASMLGRDPAEHEIRRLIGQVEAGKPLSEIVDWFTRSAQYKQTVADAVARLDLLPPNAIELDMSEPDRHALWAHVAEVWARAGSEDPYWSVITTEEFRSANMSRSDRIGRFYETGRTELARLDSYLARNGLLFPEDELCVDYGCGVGRVTLWLARRCRRVLAVDVSEPHLELARRRIAAAGLDNVEYCLVRRAADLAALRGMALCHSLMAFQHNPPPLIAEMLSAVFENLAPGGLAFLQLPTYAVGYSWNWPDYDAGLRRERRMELHVLPQAKVHELAGRGGCRLLEMQTDSYVKIGVPHWISNTFLFRKDGAATSASG